MTPFSLFFDLYLGSVCRFYTLMVLSTALFDKPAFQNLICNGLVLAEDGKKMSKRLQNYPPPTDIIDEYGAVSELAHFTQSLYPRAAMYFVEYGFNLNLFDCLLTPSCVGAGCTEIVPYQFSCCERRTAQI